VSNNVYVFFICPTCTTCFIHPSSSLIDWLIDWLIIATTLAQQHTHTKPLVTSVVSKIWMILARLADLTGTCVSDFLCAGHQLLRDIYVNLPQSHELTAKYVLSVMQARFKYAAIYMAAWRHHRDVTTRLVVFHISRQTRIYVNSYNAPTTPPAQNYVQNKVP
jgi:hypothetical protein